MQILENSLSTYDSLLWYSQMGVELCVEEVPQKVVASEQVYSDNIVNGSPRSLPAEDLAVSTPPALATPSIAEAVVQARALADGAADLASLYAAIQGFGGCALRKTATNTVLADGLASSGLMLLGDVPGAEEDRSGVAFCGPSGQLLDKMLGCIGLTRATDYYVSNCLFWRPPGNRQPTADELEICRPLVEKHIALANPHMLVLLGGTATASVLRDTRGITRLRGQVFSYKNDYMSAAVPVHVLYHPSYLLRQPLAKKLAWADLLALKTALANKA